MLRSNAPEGMFENAELLLEVMVLTVFRSSMQPFQLTELSEPPTQFLMFTAEPAANALTSRVLGPYV